ncbi:MAG: spermidine synthase [Actinomadura sp.]
MAERRGPMPGRYRISRGTAELLRDADREHGWLLSVGGVPQSYVDLADPGYLDFEYMRLMGDVVDRLGDRRAAIDAVHVGGAACTLPRYVAATRPGSRQVVFEPDAGLVQVVREQLALEDVPRLTVQITDGRTGVAGLPAATGDLVAVDAFCAGTMAMELVTREFTRDVARVLRPGGVHLVNVSDEAALTLSRRVVATVRTTFPHVVLLGEPDVLLGQRLGNLVVAASPAPLPVAALARVVGDSAVQARCVHGDDLDGFCAGAAPLTDDVDARVR